MTNFGTLYVAPGRNVIGFSVAHEELHREALLTVREVRALMAELERMLTALEKAPPTPTPEPVPTAANLSVFD